MNTIRIKIQSYDQGTLDRSTERILKTIVSTGTIVVGPIPLPTKKEHYTVLRAPHVQKKAREQFERRIYARLLDVKNPNSKAVDALMKLSMPASIDVQVKA